MTVCFCVSLFNLCCFTLRTDVFGNLPSGGRTKTRKTIQAGRFKHERKTENSDVTMSRCTKYDDVTMYVSTTKCINGFASVTAQLESPRSLRLRCDECSPASILKKKARKSQVNLVIIVALDNIISRSFGRIASVSCFHSPSFKELLRLRRFKYPALQPLANCNIWLDRLANFDFACKAAMGSGKNQMSIDRGKFYLHSFANTSLDLSSTVNES